MMQTTPTTTPAGAIIGTVGTVQPAGPTPPAPVQQLAVDWSVIIPLLFAGVALLITTSVSAWGSLRARQESRATKTTVETNAAIGAAAGKSRDDKLDHITILVNGRYSQVLQELAEVKRLLAVATGRVADHVAADQAARAAADQAAKLAELTRGTPEPA